MKCPFEEDEEEEESGIHPTDEELMNIWLKLRLASPDTYGVIAVRYARLILEVYGS